MQSLIDCPPCRVHFATLSGGHVKNGFRPRCLRLKRKVLKTHKTCEDVQAKTYLRETYPNGRGKRSERDREFERKKATQNRPFGNERHWVAFSWNSHLLRNILGGKCLDRLVTISSYQWFRPDKEISKNYRSSDSIVGKTSRIVVGSLLSWMHLSRAVSAVLCLSSLSNAIILEGVSIGYYRGYHASRRGNASVVRQSSGNRSDG